MTVACPRGCTGRWRATGRVFPSRRGRLRAFLVCETCGQSFSSGLSAALVAATAVRAANGDAPVEEPPVVRIPQPSLPMPEVHQRRHAGFVSMKSLATVVAQDVKARQIAPEREPGRT